MIFRIIFVPLFCYVIALSANNTFRIITNIQGGSLCCVATSSTIIQSYTVTSCQPECAHLCWKNPNCNGFNYAKKLSSSNCQLYLSFSGMFEESSNSNYECQFFSRTSFDAFTAPSIFLTEQPTRATITTTNEKLTETTELQSAATTLETFNCVDKNPCGLLSSSKYPYSSPDKYVSCPLLSCTINTCPTGKYFNGNTQACQ